MKKTRSRKSRDTVPLRMYFYWNFKVFFTESEQCSPKDFFLVDCLYILHSTIKSRFTTWGRTFWRQKLGKLGILYCGGGFHHPVKPAALPERSNTALGEMGGGGGVLGTGK